MLGENFKNLKNIFLANFLLCKMSDSLRGDPTLAPHLLSVEQNFIPKEQLFTLQKICLLHRCPCDSFPRQDKKINDPID